MGVELIVMMYACLIVAGAVAMCDMKFEEVNKEWGKMAVTLSILGIVFYTLLLATRKADAITLIQMTFLVDVVMITRVHFKEGDKKMKAIYLAIPLVVIPNVLSEMCVDGSILMRIFSIFMSFAIVGAIYFLSKEVAKRMDEIPNAQ